MLNVVQTVGVIAAALVAAYAVAATETSRRLAARRARVERVLDAALELAEAAVLAEDTSGQGARLQVARMKLSAELKVVGLTGFEHVELMTRPQLTPAEVASQSEQAILEISARLDELAPRPFWRRQRQIDFRTRKT